MAGHVGTYNRGERVTLLMKNREYEIEDAAN